MPYSNRRRHNSSSIPQTPYQTLISPQERRILKREREREEQVLKSKRGETSVEKLHVLKKEDEICKLIREILSKKKKERRSQFPIVQNPMCGLIHTHTSFAFALPPIP
jgi:hypothetical protein